MDLLHIVEENFLISFIIVLCIGILQGLILGRGIRQRFPSLKKHARLVSIVLLFLFSFNAVANVVKFALPGKLSLSDLTVPSTSEEGFSFVMQILGLNAGFGIVVAMFISITIILFLRLAEIPTIAKYFIFSISVIMLITTAITRFTDFVPTLFQILIYAFYQFGITIGIFFVTRRKETDVLSELK